MKKMVLLALALLLVPCMALAGADGGFLMQPPQEVLAHIARSFPTYTLEDYSEVEGTPEGDFGFALLKAGDERLLLGYEEKDGKMSYWLKSHGAVMQGTEEAWFDSRAKGTTVYGENHEIKQADGLSFSITQLDSAGETYNEYIAYHWEDGGFKLTGYKDWDGFYGEVAVDEGVLHFKNWLEGWDFGKVYGNVQRDLRYVSFASLPKTVEAARKAISSAPALEHDVLYSVPNIFVKEVKFTGGKNYPVYQGPGEEYGRAANGKASVSTNDWIQVFCRYNGYAMIQYDISAEQYRVGWIDEAALPKGVKIEEIDLGLEREDNTEIYYDCVLTDDPYNSCKPIARLKKGTPVLEVIYHLYGWSYVRVEVDGQILCGFVPSDAPVHG